MIPRGTSIYTSLGFVWIAVEICGEGREWIRKD